MTVLFGNLLGISPDQARWIAVVSALVIVALLAIARPLLFASVDADVAAARGVPVRALGLGFLALLAVTVSAATLAVGALLVFALLLLPAAIAQQLTTRPYAALALAAAIGVAVTWLGIAVGFYTGYPSSVCISLLAVAGYAVVVGGGRVAGWWGQGSEGGEHHVMLHYSRPLNAPARFVIWYTACARIRGNLRRGWS